MELALFAFLLTVTGWVLTFSGMRLLFPDGQKPIFFLPAGVSSVFAFLCALLFPDLLWLWIVLEPVFMFLTVEFTSTEISFSKRICAVILIFGISLSAYLTKLQMFPGWSFHEIMGLPLSASWCFCSLFFFTGFYWLCLVIVPARMLIHREKGSRIYRSWLLYLAFPASQYFLIDRDISAGALAGDFRQAVSLAGIVLLAAASDCLIAIAIRNIGRSQEVRTRYRMLQRQVEEQETYYRKLAEHYETIRYLRHDMNNHVSTLKILLRENRLDELDLYLKTLNRTNLFETRPAFCENPVADLFLSEKKAELREKGIGLDIDLALPADSGVGNGSLLLALDGLLSYAAKNCADVPDRRIFLSAAQEDQGLSVTVSFPGKSEMPIGNRKATGLADPWKQYVTLSHTDGICSVRVALPEVTA